MGQYDGQKEMFSYQVDLDRRVRADHPLRAIRARIDFRFVRDEVAHCNGYNGKAFTYSPKDSTASSFQLNSPDWRDANHPLGNTPLNFD